MSAVGMGVLTTRRVSICSSWTNPSSGLGSATKLCDNRKVTSLPGALASSSLSDGGVPARSVSYPEPLIY